MLEFEGKSTSKNDSRDNFNVKVFLSRHKGSTNLLVPFLYSQLNLEAAKRDCEEGKCI